MSGTIMFLLCKTFFNDVFSYGFYMWIPSNQIQAYFRNHKTINHLIPTLVQRSFLLFVGTVYGLLVQLF